MSAPKNDTAGSPYQVPPEPNRWPSIGLAVGVHALLLAFLWIGVSWQNNTPVTLEAEVWDVQTQTAAPPPPPPTPAPEPEPEPETPPPPTVPRAVEPPPPPVVKPAPPKTPDIALEREKKRKEELQRKQEQQEEERLERQRELAEQQRADEKKAKALADKKERELAEKAAEKAAEKKARELAEKKEADKKAEQLAKLEQAKKEEADKKKKADKEKADKLAKEKAKEAEQLAKLAKMTRDSETKRLTGSGNPGSTGSAEKSTAPRLDAGYLGAIAAKIKSNANYAGDTDVPGNPTVSFIVQQLPTGEIVSVKKVKSSGIPEFDEAVERSINKSSPLPKKKDGTVEKTLPVNFHMKDLN